MKKRYQSGGPSDRPDISTSPYQSATYLLEACSTRCPWAAVETVLLVVLVWLQEVINSAGFYPDTYVVDRLGYVAPPYLATTVPLAYVPLDRPGGSSRAGGALAESNLKPRIMSGSAFTSRSAYQLHLSMLRGAALRYWEFPST